MRKNWIAAGLTTLCCVLWANVVISHPGFGSVDTAGLSTTGGVLGDPSTGACATFDDRGMQGCNRVGDTAAESLLGTGQSAFERASSNTTGADRELAGGAGTNKFTMTAANCSGDTVEITVRSTPNVLTEGSSFDCSGTDAQCAASLDTAIDGITGVSGSSATNVVGVAKDADVPFISITESDATCSSASSGTNGEVVLWTPFDMNGNLVYDSTGPAMFGKVTVSSHGLGENDFMFNAETGGEFNSQVFFDAAIRVFGEVFNGDDKPSYWGGARDTRLQYTTAQTPDSLILTCGTDSRTIIVAEEGDHTTDFGAPLQADCTLRLQSSDATSPEQHLSFTHNQSDARMTIGTGDLEVEDSEGKGGVYGFRTNSESLTFTGEASQTTSGLIPDGAHLFSVTTRVTTALTTCTSYDAGSATVVDIYADGIAVALGSVSTNAEGGPVQWGNPQKSAEEVTITAVGAATCDAGVVFITALFIEHAAPTSN